jgi:DNA (cytosine-5)-methyltransferase 1
MLKCFNEYDLEKIFKKPFGENEAAFTHYLNNYLNDVPNFYKDSALDFINDNVSYQNKEVKNINKISEEALQYQIFDFKKLLNIPFPEPEKTTFKFIDLFAGVGGFRLALQSLGGKCIFSSEIEDNAKKTYLSNYGEIPFGDITKEKTKSYIPDNFDILCGGFPCQAFSIAGYQKGFSDTRGTLFFELEQIINKKKPKVIFLENVKNLQSHDNGKTFKIMIDVLENKLGYKVFFKILNSMTHANIPQNRERIFIVAFDPNKVKNWSKFEFPNQIPLKTKIHDLIEDKKQDDIYYYGENHPYYSEFKKVIKSKDTLYQWRRVYVRENKSNVCPTLTANMGTGGHNVPLILDNYGFRKLTPRECFNFQGYPKEFVLPSLANSKLYMQAGNSVTMPLIKRIGEKILNIL